MHKKPILLSGEGKFDKLLQLESCSYEYNLVAMKQLLNHRTFILVFGFISILILILLSTSLESLDFKKSSTAESVGIVTTKEFRGGTAPESDWYVIVAAVVLSILIIISLIFGKPKQIPSVLPLLIPLVIISFVFAWWISRANIDIDDSQYGTPVPISISSLEAPQPVQEQVPESTYIPQKISPWISFGFTFSTLFSILMVIWFILHKRKRSHVPLDNIAGIAEEAIINLQSGKDYENVVIECYAKMIAELNNQRSIQRSADLTPTEFIGVLTQAGVPVDPVRTLTALFERVRYGGNVTSEKDINEASVCLTGIVSSIRGIDEK